MKGDGFRVSIDSFQRREVEDAVAAGAELVLSCNGTNVDWAAQLPAELVAIPDDIRDLSSLERTIEQLDACEARYRIDPVLEPIGHGFSRSLDRYLQARERWPNAEMMMGVGNVTELTEVDSAGINVILAGVCEELSIRECLDDASHQLGSHQRSRVGPGPAHRVLLSDERVGAQTRRLAIGDASRSARSSR